MNQNTYLSNAWKSINQGVGWLLVALFLPFLAYPQTVSISSEVPITLTVCQPADSFRISLVNDGSTSLSSPQVESWLPSGIQYVPGSLVEETNHSMAEASLANLERPAFSVNAIPAGDSLVFTVATRALPEAIDFLLAGNTFRNKVKLYHGGDSNIHQSAAYNLLYAALSITNLNPVSKSLSPGEIYSRSIRVANAGYGRVSSFYITDERAIAGLNLIASNLGQLNSAGDTIFLDGTDFQTIGNGDGYFDSNESITVQETLQASGCQSTTITSNIRAHWGCDGTVRSTVSSYAHASLGYDAPNIQVALTSDLDACFGSGVASTQELRLTNNGSGLAKAIQLDLYKSSGSGYDEDLFSRIDDGSIQYQVGNGAFQPLTPANSISTRNDGQYACLGANPVGRVLLNLPDMAAGEQITVTWDAYHCAINVCNNDLLKGWEYAVDYEDQCNIQAYNKAGTGENVNSETLVLFSESPSDINDDETETFTYTISSYENDLPAGDGAQLELLFTLPVGLAFANVAGDLSFQSGPNIWQALQTVYNANAHTITASYAFPEPFILDKSEVMLRLAGDCTQPGAAAGPLSIELDVNYIPDTTCTPVAKIPFACDFTVDVDLHCPATGPCEGLRFMAYSIDRTSFGQPDNDQDGLADASGTLNPAKIKRNRAMVGDTLRGMFSGLVGTSTANPQWNYGYCSTIIELGTNLTPIGASVLIYDQSQGQYLSCDQVLINSSSVGTTKTFTYDFSPATVAGSCTGLSGYQFADGDSVWVYADYKVTGNIGGQVKEVKATNAFYLSNVANPTTQQRFQCDYYNDKFTLIGYYFENTWKNNYSVKTCTKTIQQNFWFSIGNCCSNYAGGNLFPHEYRNWAFVKKARVTIPDHYEVLNSRVNFRRTRYTNAVVTKTVNPISPASHQGNVLTYDLQQHYEAFGGSVQLSDDGFQGTLFLELAPSCDVPDGVYQDVSWEFQFGLSEFLGGGETTWYTEPADRIRFSPTNLELSSANPIVDGLQKTVSWDVSVRNTTGNTDASTAWIHLKAPSGELEILSIHDVSTGTDLALSGDIYQLGTIKRSSTKNYRITARYNACNVDKLWIYSGYECSGYPESFYAFSCPYSQMELRVEPKPAELQAIISGTTIGGACASTVEVTVELASVKLAIVDSISVQVTLPTNGSLTYLNQSSNMRYPLSNSFASIADPAESGTTYTFPISVYNATIANRGLPGVLNLDSNRLQLQFQLNLEGHFQPGDYVQVAVQGQEACGQKLPVINLAYDPSVKFQKNQTSGLSSQTGSSWSVAWVDYNNDGFEDVFVTNYDAHAPSVLQINNGDGTFSVANNVGPLVTDDGAAVSSTWGDFNNDGHIDVFVSNNTGAVNALYKNNGDGTFSTQAAGDLSDYSGYCHNAAWADYDNDGYLDLFVTEYFPTRFNLLYHNDGDGTFTKQSGGDLLLAAGQSIGATWCDYDNDGDADLFVPNTNGGANGLYRNDGGGTFVKTSPAVMPVDNSNSVGGSWGDYDNDGDMDLFVANSGGQNNALYENQGDGTFLPVTQGIVVSEGGNSHGSAWADFDNDGDLDLFVTNDQMTPNCLYTNNGDGTFSKGQNVINSDLANSFGTAWGDPDNDGDLDLLVANRSNGANDYYTNSKGSCNAWACFRLEGVQSNRSAIGAKVRVKANIYGTETWQVREISAQTGGGAGGQSTLKALFGLGDAAQLDSVIIEWPSGMIQYMTNVAVNDCQDVVEASGALVSGRVYFDANSNCTYDAGEQTLSGVIINTGQHVLATDDQGNYATYLNAGNYTIQAEPNSNWTDTCGTTKITYPIDVLGNPGEVHTDLDFPLNAVAANPDLTVDLGTTALRRGFRNTLVVSYENLGPAVAQNSVLQLVLPDEVQILSSDVPWTRKIGNTYEWDLGDVGIDGSGVITLMDSIAVDAELGAILQLTANISTTTTETNLQNNDATVSDVVVGSVDPNDKLAFPQGQGDRHLISPVQPITYKIRFQNVGNYKASRVIIVDTLSKYLDFNTVSEVMMSHEGTLERLEGGILRFVFLKIELPDSTSNEPESHGFVQFKVLPKAGILPESMIRNQASIVFDYNEAIITNWVEHTISKEVQQWEDLWLHIYPNPTRGKGFAEVRSKDSAHEPLEIEELIVYTISGVEVERFRAAGQVKVRFDAANLNRGAYLLKARVKEGYWYAGKLLVP